MTSAGCQLRMEFVSELVAFGETLCVHTFALLKKWRCIKMLQDGHQHPYLECSVLVDTKNF